MLLYDLLLSQNMVWRLTHILVQIVTLILINIQYFTYEHTIMYLFILLFMDFGDRFQVFFFLLWTMVLKIILYTFSSHMCMSFSRAYTYGWNCRITGHSCRLNMTTNPLASLPSREGVYFPLPLESGFTLWLFWATEYDEMIFWNFQDHAIKWLVVSIFSWKPNAML